MKKIFIIILIAITTFPMAKITPQQDENNTKFLKNLDTNLVDTIKLLAAYNNVANKISSDVKGLGTYRRFLMDTTLETGKLRDKIKNAKKTDEYTKEIVIRDMVISIKSDTKFYEKHISKKRDKENKKYLAKAIGKYLKKINEIRQSMMIEEKKIMKDEKFTKKYFALHSANYLYTLLIDFMKVNNYLTPQNREYLTNIVRSVEK